MMDSLFDKHPTEMHTHERIRMVISRAGCTDAAFARSVGNFSRTSLSQILQGKRTAPTSLLRAISDTYGVRYNWLLTGEGYMTDKNDKATTISTRTFPHLIQTAAAGMLTTDLQAECEQMPEVAFMPRYDFTIEVCGNSMEPSFLSGDILACRDVSRDSFLQWGKPHVLATNQGIIVKRIYEEDNAIRCVSDNTTYHDFTIPRNEVYSLALVVGMMRRE